MVLINTGRGRGCAYNICQDEILTVEEFLALLAGLAGYELHLTPVHTQCLESRNLLFDCSPFSDPWMSVLDNRRSKAELGQQYASLAAYPPPHPQHVSYVHPQRLQYTPLVVYLQRLITHYQSHQPPTPASYRCRQAELDLARDHGQRNAWLGAQIDARAAQNRLISSSVL
jgi:hypothetical protein